MWTLSKLFMLLAGICLCTILIVTLNSLHGSSLVTIQKSLRINKENTSQNLMNENSSLFSIFITGYNSSNGYIDSQKLMEERGSGTDEFEEDGCIQSSRIYKSWNQGVVTVFQPEVAVNCSKVMEGEKHEVDRVVEVMSQWRSALSSKDLLKKVQNCSWLREYMANNFYNSKLEREFPLAFILVVYDSPEQILRLLRVLYRKQNSFCIHCDAKSPQRIFFQSIASCFENIVVPPVLEKVIWGHSSILVAQVKCIVELMKLRSVQVYKWQYLITLCGKELPLATNREMVIKLMKLNGSSNIIPRKVTKEEEESNSRIKYRVRLDQNETKIIMDTNSLLGEPPFDVSKYYHKSQGHIALSFQFVHHLAHNNRAFRIYNFFLNCLIPEEHYYATIFMMPEVPGGYSETTTSYSHIIGKFWISSYNCSGEVVHSICVIGARDLANAVSKGRDKFFHNKYFMEHDHSPMKCIEESLVARNKEEYKTDYMRRATHDISNTIN